MPCTECTLSYPASKQPTVVQRHESEIPKPPPIIGSIVWNLKKKRNRKSVTLMIHTYVIWFGFIFRRSVVYCLRSVHASFMQLACHFWHDIVNRRRFRRAACCCCWCRNIKRQFGRFIGLQHALHIPSHVNSTCEPCCCAVGLHVRIFYFWPDVYISVTCTWLMS